MLPTKTLSTTTSAIYMWSAQTEHGRAVHPDQRPQRRGGSSRVPEMRYPTAIAQSLGPNACDLPSRTSLRNYEGSLSSIWCCHLVDGCLLLVLLQKAHHLFCAWPFYAFPECFLSLSGCQHGIHDLQEILVYDILVSEDKRDVLA